MLSSDRNLEGIDIKEKSIPMCFGCGHNNPIGLNLKFNHRQDEATSEFILGKAYQGWDGFIHGGILCAILDEAMAHSCFPRIRSVTAKTEFRFKQLAPIGVPMVVTGKLLRETRRLLTTSAIIKLKDGTIVATGTGTLYVITPNHKIWSWFKQSISNTLTFSCLTPFNHRWLISV